MPKHSSDITVITDNDYRQWLIELKQRYRSAQLKAASRVNEELLRYYWQLGADIHRRGDENRYGTQFYDILSRDLQQLMPEVDGFSRKNLQNATRFYRFYTIDTIRQQLVSDLQDAEDEDSKIRKQLVSNLEIASTADFLSPLMKPSSAFLGDIMSLS